MLKPLHLSRNELATYVARQLATFYPDGLDADASGLLELPADAPVGAPLADYLGLPDSSIERVLPPDLTQLISSVKVFIVENIRTARRFLKKVNQAIVIDDLTFFELNQHTDKKEISRFLEPIQQGMDIGIIQFLTEFRVIVQILHQYIAQ